MKQIAEQISTVVCDDIRHEMSNKISLIGVYDDLNINSIPAILPKLCFAVLLHGISKPFKKIQIHFIPPDEQPVDLGTKDPPKDFDFRNLNINTVLSPFKIEKTGEYIWEVRFDDAKKPAIVHKLLINCPNAE